MQKVPLPEPWGESKVNPSKSIGESIIDSVVDKPQRKVMEKWKERLWKERGKSPIKEARPELLDETEKAGQ